MSDEQKKLLEKIKIKEREKKDYNSSNPEAVQAIQHDIDLLWHRYNNLNNGNESKKNIYCRAIVWMGLNGKEPKRCEIFISDNGDLESLKEDSCIMIISKDSVLAQAIIKGDQNGIIEYTIKRGGSEAVNTLRIEEKEIIGA